MSDCSGGSCSSCSSCSSDDPDRLPPGMLSRYNINESTADGTLIWVELVEGAEGPHVSDVSAELIAAAKGMDDGRVFAVVFGGLEVKPLYSEIFGYGADSLYHVRERSLESYSPEAYAGCLASIVERVSPAVILIGSTSRGREVAPRLAAMLGTGLTADCTGLSMDGRKLVMTRPAFGGNLLADIECTKFPQMATVRQGSFPRPEKVDGQGTAIYWQYTDGMLKDVLSEEPIAGPSDDIRDAKVLDRIPDRCDGMLFQVPGRKGLDATFPSGGHVRTHRRTRHLPGVRDIGRCPAPCGHVRFQEDSGNQ